MRETENNSRLILKKIEIYGVQKIVEGNIVKVNIGIYKAD